MAGSMRERSPGLWELRVYAGRDDTGRVRHLHRYVRGGKRKAAQELARLQIEVESAGSGHAAVAQASERRRSAQSVRKLRSRAGSGDSLPTDEARAQARVARTGPAPQWGPETTINDAIEAWRHNGWDDLSPATVRRYQNMWDVHIRHAIGTSRLTEIGPYDVETFFRRLKAEGLAESSIRQIRAILHRACRLARKWSNQTLPNPVADTEIPGYTLAERTPEVRAPSAEEVRALIDAAMELDLRIGVFVRVVAATGVRRGEAAALRWSDLDLDAGTARIDEGIVADEGGARVKSPKTRASVRTVALDEGTVDALRALRMDRERFAQACGVSLTKHGFVFATEPGGETPPHPDAFSHAFAQIRRLAGVGADVHLHSLRHFQSTALDSVISEAQKQARMGWATVKMARHYTDAIGIEDRRAADHIGSLLGGTE